MSKPEQNQIREVMAHLRKALEGLSVIDRQLSADPAQATADAAIANLTDAGRDLMHYVAGKGGTADYFEALKVMGLETRQLGGILSGVTKRALPGEPPVIHLRDKDGGWDLVIESSFRDAALFAEIGV